MATAIALSDRRARLAVILAALGVPSLGITVPAAIWLGVGSLRQRRLSSGGEPAMGFLALVIAGLDVMMLNSVILKTVELLDPQRTWTGVAWGVTLAAAAVVCTASILRIHPERWGALLAARAGLVAAMAGGLTLFARLVVAFE
jgi:hypothetical protein